MGVRNYLSQDNLNGTKRARQTFQIGLANAVEFSGNLWNNSSRGIQFVRCEFRWVLEYQPVGFNQLEDRLDVKAYV